MNNKELLDELDQDLKVNKTQIMAEAANNPILLAKWLRYYSDVRREVFKANCELARVKKERLDWLNGRGDEICEYHYEKSEVKTVLEGDDLYQRALGKLEIANIKFDTCKSALDAIKSRGFSIKNVIDMRILESGR